jgi:hypothetical protein
LPFRLARRTGIVTFGVAIIVAAAIYAGLTWYLRSRSAFLVGVALTLAFWGAAFGLPPSYANALWFLLGLVGSGVFGLTGTVAWWRARRLDGETQWAWLVGSALAVAPVILLGFHQLLRNVSP